ncbi:FkbM family methyltransferase [Gymnodinialimonas sp. 57CJ19]|uniref:FkbM family methyltransferase n=1 Tax=Gymnodinialimonas sp. 57CJ19 TaxID=3138498 RepID=UPI0031343357
MADPFRNIRRKWHLMKGTSSYTHKGVRLRTGPKDIPSAVRGHIFKGTYEAVEAELVKEVVAPGNKVLEVGTGIGFVSILCAKIAGEGNVTSYEANPAMGDVIRKNYAENGLQSDLRMHAVTVNGSPIQFFADANVLSSSMIDRNLPTTEITVESDAMADVMERVAPDVIVMDVEGAEVDLLSSADLSDVHSMIVEVHPHIVGAEKIAAMETALAEKGLFPVKVLHKTVLYQRSAP